MMGRILLVPVIAALTATFAACAMTVPAGAQNPPAGGQSDQDDPSLVPAGFGTLRQDDISLRIAPSSGLQVRAIPLDEHFIRLLSPDSYKTLHDLKRDKEREIEDAKRRQPALSYSLWYVSFFAVEQGETRFSPYELIIRNTGRDFRPIDVIPLTTGFGEYRLRQREVQSAIYVFDGQLDLNQDITASMESVESTTKWQSVLQRVERERSMVRSRAASGKSPGL